MPDMFKKNHNNVLSAICIASLCCLSLAAISPNFAWLLFDEMPFDLLQQILFLSIATVGLFLSLTSRIWIGALLLLPWAVIAPFEFYYVSTFEKFSDSHLIGIIVDTNFSEAGSFISGIILKLGILSILFIFIGIVAVFLAFRQRWVWHGRSRYRVLLISMLALGTPQLFEWILMLSDLAQARPLPNLAQTDASDLGLELSDAHFPGLFGYMMPVYPAGIPVRLYSYAEQRRALNQAKPIISTFRFGAYQEAVTDKRQIYVLVIGETGRPDHWQLNGYYRETNPRLMGMQRVVSFKNAFSAWAWSRMAIPLILTRKPALDSNQFFPERSLVSAFREAGFKTYWISTQSPLGPHDSSIALHAAEAHETHYLNPADYHKAGVFDGALLAPVDEVLRRQEPKVLIVLHTLGSHFNYADRYPDSYDVFKPSLKGVRGAALDSVALKEEFNNSYDNSVLYTDYFLSELIGRLSKIHAVVSMFYIADHGENLFDGDCKKAGHGHNNEYDFRVPALWWFSEEYENIFPNKVATMREKVDAPIQNTHVFHSMLDGAQIRYPGEQLESSLFSQKWRYTPRLTQDKVDFDRVGRDSICRKLQ